MGDDGSDLTGKLGALADQLLDESLGSEDAAFKLDAFKVLSRFWIDRTKLGKKAPDESDQDDTPVPSMIDMKRRLRAVTEE